MMTLKGMRVLSGGILLFLGLFSMPQIGDGAFAADKLKKTPCEIQPGQNAMQAEQDAMRKSHMVSGEVVHVDGVTYVVKEKGGKEVSLQIDERTEKSPLNKGDHVSANVDDQNHALWIRSNESTDRRSEHAATDCNPSQN